MRSRQHQGGHGSKDTPRPRPSAPAPASPASYLTLRFLGHELGQCQLLHGGIGQDAGVRGFPTAFDHGRLQRSQEEPARGVGFAVRGTCPPALPGSQTLGGGTWLEPELRAAGGAVMGQQATVTQWRLRKGLPIPNGQGALGSDSEGSLARGCSRTGTPVPSGCMQAPCGGRGRRGPAARLCFLPAVTHATPSSLQSPGLTANQPVGMSVYFLASLTRPQGPEGIYLCPHFFLCHFPPSTRGRESKARPPQWLRPILQLRGGRVSLTQPELHRPCPAETASCGWCTPASPPAGPGPPARDHTSHAHGPGRCQKSSHSQTEGQAGGRGGRAPWGRHEVKLQRPGTLAIVREGWTERHPQARLLPPAPWTEAARRGAGAQPRG